MKNVIFNIIELFIGFSSGLLIGSAFVALLIVLGIIPRLLQLVKVKNFISYLIIALLFGVLLGSYLTFFADAYHYGSTVLLLWGLFNGIFNGMLAAALVEVLNVFPLLSRRLRLESYMLVLLTSFVFGKVFGSLFQWLVLN